MGHPRGEESPWELNLSLFKSLAILILKRALILFRALFYLMEKTGVANGMSHSFLQGMAHSINGRNIQALTSSSEYAGPACKGPVCQAPAEFNLMLSDPVAGAPAAATKFAVMFLFESIVTSMVGWVGVPVTSPLQ
jgi:hypothetical protein